MDCDREKQYRKQISALIDTINNIYGTEKMVLKAGKLEALGLIRSRQPGKQLLGLQRVIFENPTLEELASEEQFPGIIEELEEALAELMARRTLEESLEYKIKSRLEERHDEYLQEIKRQVIKEVSGVESPHTLKKYAQTEKMFSQELSRSAMEMLRPGALDEIVGQEKAVTALVSKLASPHPSHVILYGPPGVGKTTAARLALQHIKQLKRSPFGEEAPFVEVDGTTLRWDPREIANPLIGSVHDPIYQGARRDLVEGGVPEPKLGLVSEAHGGILFIDEIGEMDLGLQSKLLKVLEDKKVSFDSAYYDPHDPGIPKYIKMIFEQGAPADFVLIGATTRRPDTLSPALRSRCSAVFFEPLTPAEIEKIVAAAASRLKINIDPDVIPLIGRYTNEGRQAVNLLVDAYGRALYLEKRKGRLGRNSRIDLKLMQEVMQSNRLFPLNPASPREKTETGRVYALGAHGFTGTVLEIEAVAFAAETPGRGSIRFNETAGSMTRDSVFVAASVLRRLAGINVQDYDLHLNVVGGANINGPSAGAAILIAILSAVENVPLRQDCAITGELSLRGHLKPVGGLTEKIYGARLAGFKKMVIPDENRDDFTGRFPDMRIIPTRHIGDVLPIFFNRRIVQKWFNGEVAAHGYSR